MTDLQLSHLKRILVERKRRLVCVYTANDGRTYAVSRPAGQRSAKQDQCHLLDLTHEALVQIIETTGNT